MTSIVDSDGGSGLIRSDRRGRVLIGAAQREALLDEFDCSGLSAMAFCRLHGLVYPTFATWVQKRRRRPSATPAFAEVIVESSDEVVAAARDVVLRVTLAGGVTLEMSAREQLPLAVELIRQLAADPFPPTTTPTQQPSGNSGFDMRARRGSIQASQPKRLRGVQVCFPRPSPAGHFHR